jgi:Uma2 family endonuclease
MASARSSVLTPSKPEPAWDIARLFPEQGFLDEDDYLQLTDHTNRMAEFTDGKIEVLPMPTAEHQFIVLFLMDLIRSFVVQRKLGLAIMAPFRIKITNMKFREPDIAFLLARNMSHYENRFWTGADLVMEVVSKDNPKRDLITKRRDYAEAGIAEYWLVDPRTKTITVLKLKNGRYVTFSDARTKGQIRSALLDGLTANVEDVFAAAQR